MSCLTSIVTHLGKIGATSGKLKEFKTYHKDHSFDILYFHYVYGCIGHLDKVHNWSLSAWLSHLHDTHPIS